MISPERFGDKRDVAMRILEHISADLTAQLGVEARFELVSKVDDTLLARMQEIEEELFRIEDNVYTESDLLECLAMQDAMLLVLTIDGNVEGYLFGYADDRGNPVVEGCDFFVDSALISLAYEAKGIGGRFSLPVLFLIHLLGYKVAGLTTEEQDKTGRKLANFYRKLGFVDTPVNREGDVGIGFSIDLTPEALKQIAERLPNTEYLVEALDA
jgi:GNAT superfamily N-acetyltransferase